MKRAAGGQALLNLGCGTRTHPDWTNVDFSVYTRLRRHAGLARLLHEVGIISSQRWERLQALDADVVSWDLRRGIPFEDATFDVVFHSHLLEHLAREAAPAFLKECLRVLTPGGLLRVVVPDLERLAASYLHALARLDCGDSRAWADYDRVVDQIFEQMVRREGVGTAQQRSAVRVTERLIRGGATRIGELHRWMYDRHALGRLLDETGFVEFTTHRHDSSGIVAWARYGLDCDSSGSPVKPESLYVEARKPASALGSIVTGPWSPVPRGWPG